MVGGKHGAISNLGGGGNKLLVVAVDLGVEAVFVKLTVKLSSLLDQTRQVGGAWKHTVLVQGLLNDGRVLDVLTGFDTAARRDNQLGLAVINPVSQLLRSEASKDYAVNCANPSARQHSDG